MTSERKIVANRENAKKSSGPRSAAGRLRSGRNAYRHGLAIDIELDPTFSVEIKKMAKAIAGADNQHGAGLFAHKLAEAEIDLSRIREIRASMFKVFYERASIELQDIAELNDGLSKLERYERRAFSRRKRALRCVGMKVSGQFSPVMLSKNTTVLLWRNPPTTQQIIP